MYDLILKNAYINNLNDIVNEVNNKYHSTNKMKPIDKSSTYVNISIENNGKDPKFDLTICNRMKKRKNGLKLDIDDLDVDKIKTDPVDLHKLSNSAEKEVGKKTAFVELVKKVNVISTINTSAITQKLARLKRKFLAMINILLLKNLIS